MEPLDGDRTGHDQGCSQSYAERIAVLNLYRSNASSVPRLNRTACLGITEGTDTSAVLVNDARSVLSQTPCDGRLNQRLVLSTHIQLLAVVPDLSPVRERNLERNDVVLNLVRNDLTRVENGRYSNDGLAVTDGKWLDLPWSQRGKGSHLHTTFRTTC
ncbi:hypothetical protein D3C75_664520 [compost metagenome]